jgi:hypothetical protein
MRGRRLLNPDLQIGEIPPNNSLDGTEQAADIEVLGILPGPSARSRYTA